MNKVTIGKLKKAIKSKMSIFATLWKKETLTMNPKVKMESIFHHYSFGLVESKEFCPILRNKQPFRGCSDQILPQNCWLTHFFLQLSPCTWNMLHKQSYFLTQVFFGHPFIMSRKEITQSDETQEQCSFNCMQLFLPQNWKTWVTRTNSSMATQPLSLSYFIIT